MTGLTLREKEAFEHSIAGELRRAAIDGQEIVVETILARRDLRVIIPEAGKGSLGDVLSVAALNGHTTIVEKILPFADRIPGGGIPSTLGSALCMAARKGHGKIVDLILPFASRIPGDGFFSLGSALWMAVGAEKVNTEIVKNLLSLADRIPAEGSFPLGRALCVSALKDERSEIFNLIFNSVGRIPRSSLTKTLASLERLEVEGSKERHFLARKCLSDHLAAKPYAGSIFSNLIGGGGEG